MAGIWKIVSKSKAIWSFTNETKTNVHTKKKLKNEKSLHKEDLTIFC
jgi:hypothetical protein